MKMMLKLMMVACLSAPVVASGQEAPNGHNGFAVVGGESAAPAPYGWKLGNGAVSTSVMVDGVEVPLELSRFFECGIALGTTAAAHPYLPGCQGEVAGPTLQVFPAGAVAVPRKNVAFDPANTADLLGTEVDALQGLPDLFLPRLGEAAPLQGAGACPDPNGTRGVYFYASRLDPASEGADQIVITWNDILPLGDCDAAPNSFQMIVTALPRPADADASVRPPARVEYRYGDCGWAVPDPEAVPPPQPDDGGVLMPPPVFGARSGMLFDSAGLVADGERRGIEVLGPREMAFEVENPGTPDQGALAHGRLWGASGDPHRFADFCKHSNKPPAEWEKGQFAFELTSAGVPLKDGDGDGVPDGVGGYDNCPSIANPYQGNADNVGFGDACDEDADDDGLLNHQEFCDLVGPIYFNDYLQSVDSDGDGLGDGCDSDLDGDGFSNVADNCPELANASQVDWDGDADGMRCDLDDEARFEELLRIMALLSSHGWAPSGGPMREAVEFERDEGSTTSSASTSFTERWRIATGKSGAEIWATVEAALAWPLPQTEAAGLRAAVEDAYSQTGDHDIWILYDWSKSSLGLGEFIAKHGAQFIESSN